MNCKTKDKNKTLLSLLLSFILIALAGSISAQKVKLDSLSRLLKNETVDSNKVRLLWKMASAIDIYNPDTALILSQQAYYLASEIKYVEGVSRAIGVMANAFVKLGNYPKALELNIKKLKIEEKRDNPRNMASVLNNIGVIYTLQDEYRKALEYYRKSDSLINKFNIEELKYNAVLNIGDAYNRLNISDSSYLYFSKSLEYAKNQKDDGLIGNSMTGLGHSYLRMGSYKNSRTNYIKAIEYLIKANDDEILCEATLGLSNLYKQMGHTDSAKYYGLYSISIAKKGGFVTEELNAAKYLATLYKNSKNIDSAFTYLNLAFSLNDSINSKSRIRESQTISYNEKFRQRELFEKQKLAKKERSEQLQLLFIGIFIPFLFLITLLLSRIKIQIKLIKTLGVLSLLFFFEFLTLLLHPKVAEFTHHTPFFEILIFVVMGAILIPTHHRLEHWLIEYLLKHRVSNLLKTESMNTHIGLPDSEIRAEAEVENTMTEMPTSKADAKGKAMPIKKQKPNNKK